MDLPFFGDGPVRVVQTLLHASAATGTPPGAALIARRTAVGSGVCPHGVPEVKNCQRQGGRAEQSRARAQSRGRKPAAEVPQADSVAQPSGIARFRFQSDGE